MASCCTDVKLIVALGLVATKGTPAISGAGVDSGAKDGKVVLGVEVEIENMEAFPSSGFMVVSDAREIGCSGGILKDKVEAGKEIEVKLAEVPELGPKEE